MGANPRRDADRMWSGLRSLLSRLDHHRLGVIAALSAGGFAGNRRSSRPPKDRTALVGLRKPPFLCDKLLNGTTRSASFEETGLLIEPLQRAQLLLASEFCTPNGGLHHTYRLVIDPERHREGMPVLAAVSERKSRGISEAIRGTVHHLGDHGQGTHSARANTGGEQEIRKVRRSTIGCRRQIGIEPSRVDVAGADIVVFGQVEVREQRFARPAMLGLARPAMLGLARDAVRPQREEELELHAAR